MTQSHTRTTTGPRVEVVDHPEVEGERPVLPPWVERWVSILDDGFRVPGTDMRFGLDGVIGLFVPVLGDFLTATGSLALIASALKARVPTAVLAQMVLNIAVDFVGGLVPMVGDIFDIAWKSNRRNLKLLQTHQRQAQSAPQSQTTTVDYGLVSLAVVVVVASVLVPIALIGGIAAVLIAWLK